MTIEFSRQAEKDLKGLGVGAAPALQQIYTLATDPERGELLVGTLPGARSLHFTLPQGGQFRAAYAVLEDEEVCLVFMIAPRENFYKKASTRYLALKKSGRL